MEKRLDIPRVTGIAIAVIPLKSIGFIQSTDNLNVFFRFKDLVDNKIPTVGARVSFVANRDAQGRPYATNVAVEPGETTK
jgi:cold shock CspA family protein